MAQSCELSIVSAVGDFIRASDARSVDIISEGQLPSTPMFLTCNFNTKGPVAHGCSFL